MIARQPGNQSGVARRSLFVALLALSLLLAACGPGTSVATHPTATTGAKTTQTPGGPAPASDANSIQAAATVNWYLKHMTLDEKLGQMMLVETVYQSYTSDVDNMVRNLHAGAMIVYKQNMILDNPIGPPTLRRYIKDIQAHATIPLMITMDEEGGGVDRLGLYGFAPPLPSPEDTAKTGNPQNAYDNGARGAQQMLSFGINTDLAPLADIRLTDGSILYTRMYGVQLADRDGLRGRVPAWRAGERRDWHAQALARHRQHHQRSAPDAAGDEPQPEPAPVHRVQLVQSAAAA